MPKKQAFIDKSGVKFVENFQKNQKIKKFPSRTEIRYLTAFMQKSQGEKIRRYVSCHHNTNLCLIQELGW